MKQMGKRLGQHFLRSRDTAERIVQAASLAKTDTVLEVGPGKGILTELILQQAGRVIAVEKDIELVQFLTEKFAHAENLILLHGDILNQSEIQSPHIPEKYVVVANLPYYITSRFLRVFLEGPAPRPARMVIMVQKEVAERIVATPPHMNLLGVSVQAYGTAEIVLRVPREQFSPPPEVDSAVVSITDISDKFFKKNSITPKEFFAPIKKAFSQKRKMLRSSLRISEIQSPTYRRLDLRTSTWQFTTKRPQELSLEEWVVIAKHLK